MEVSPVLRVTMTGLAGGWSCLTESAVWAKASGMVVRPSPAVVIAPSERKSRREVMAGRILQREQGTACRFEVAGSTLPDRECDGLRLARSRPGSVHTHDP